MNTHAVQAKLLLRHYLSLAVGSSYNGDDASQINSIVDHIIAAVVEELQAQPSPALVQPIEATSINQDLAVLYPNGQFRRVILDSEGFANEKKAKAQ